MRWAERRHIEPDLIIEPGERASAWTWFPRRNDRRRAGDLTSPAPIKATYYGA
jgi:hypothetical protein